MDIKILHLFPEMLSLYGERGNVEILAKTLRDAGHSVTVDRSEIFDGGKYDFVYVGSGTEDALVKAAKTLAPTTEKIKKSLEDTVWLATGNALSLFGSKIFDGEKEVAAASVFSFETKLDRTCRYMGDVTTSSENVFCKTAVGFINTSCVYSGITEPLFGLVLGAKLGNDKQSSADGFSSDNFFATQMIGPFLVKNPSALEFFAEKLCKEKVLASSDIVKAYEIAKSELEKRLP